MAVDDGEDEKPLDPTLLKVQARLRRLMLIAAGTLGVGLFAVVLAIVYRIARPDDSPPPAPPGVLPQLAPGGGAAVGGFAIDRAAAGLGPGARLVGVALDGDRALLTFEEGARSTLVLVDLAGGTIVSRLTLD